MPFTIDKKRPEMFDIEPLEDEPDNLKSIITNAPKDRQATVRYLKGLVSDGTITTDDATFLIDSGALQN